MRSAGEHARLRTLALCDLVDSTALVEHLGDHAAADLIRRHDRMARLALHRHGGREIDKTDGFLVLFDDPGDAVAFALDYQRELRALALDSAQPLAARVGIHVGDMMMWDNAPEDVAQGAKAMQVEGRVKPIAAGLMGLARPGQILMSGDAHALARRTLGSAAQERARLRWVAHGRYRFRGMNAVIGVHEVGDAGMAPLRMPRSTAQAWRIKPWWRRMPVQFGALGVLLAIAVVFAWLTPPAAPPIPFERGDSLAVEPLVNTTGDAIFDATLATAFRLAFAQSEFVEVSRANGIEAPRLRIVPSIAPRGRALRLTAELVDASGKRLALDTADAKNAAQVLPAIDTLAQVVRSRLGEPADAIATAAPALTRIASADLEALRAYARAEQVAAAGDRELAARLLAYAIELDDGFALAHARLGALFVALDRDDDARRAFQTALSLEGRLGARERLDAQARFAQLP
jgi:class 3 adenylate cyclase